MSSLKDHEDRIKALESDMWFGKDASNPPVVTRLDRLEISGKKMDKLGWIIIVGIVAALGDIISSHWK
ncbi:MAG: hypothetical protein P4L77_11940 [Sulfuriferula sp.]|nr:hypothetical protein [Sulfuriferula sp.]